MEAKTVVCRDGKDVLVDSISAVDHGQRVELRGYDNPKSHMHGWPVVRRMDSWAFPLLEIICKHGVGHPMAESIVFMDKAFPQAAGTWGIHGCDGCCIPPKERG